MSEKLIYNKFKKYLMKFIRLSVVLARGCTININYCGGLKLCLNSLYHIAEGLEMPEEKFAKVRTFI